MAKTWTLEEEAYLEIKWKTFTNKREAAAFLKALNAIGGNNRTLEACKKKAWKMGIRQRDHLGMPTVAETARDLGVVEDRLRKMLLRNPELYPTLKEGRHTVIPPETYEKISERLKPLDPEILKQTMLTREAMEILHVTATEVQLLVKFGVLKAVKDTWKLYIFRDSVERVRRLRENLGPKWLHHIRENLSDYYHRDREYNRKYLAERRRKKAS